MNRKTTQLLNALYFCSLLICLTVGAQAQEAQPAPGWKPPVYATPAPPGPPQRRPPVVPGLGMQKLTGRILLRKDFGVIPVRPGDKEPDPDPCRLFFVTVFDPAEGNRQVATINGEQGADTAEHYICRYEVAVPIGKRLWAEASMGGLRAPGEGYRLPYHLTDPWIGGTRNQPPRGWERGFVGKYFTITGKPVYLAFELIYAQVEPN